MPLVQLLLQVFFYNSVFYVRTPNKWLFDPHPIVFYLINLPFCLDNPSFLWYDGKEWR